MQSGLISIIHTIALVSQVGAWHLDRPCQDLGYGDIIRQGMTSAIDLAQAATDTLQALRDNTYNQAQMDLFEYMFGFAIETVNGQRRINQRDWAYINRSP
ncbi:hypothetical protein EYZ11_000385 [Aspergillus tanneri]|uniref:Uncharacterized protein n=1 Tax=Aspergillus tanneri TaxID=1220188 RepID=A0A4S3JXU7_9EURO|nr:hypothetical protein EYZ11_000385 [Aspergillus tanneri]